MIFWDQSTHTVLYIKVHVSITTETLLQLGCKNHPQWKGQRKLHYYREKEPLLPKQGLYDLDLTKGDTPMRVFVARTLNEQEVDPRRESAAAPFNNVGTYPEQYYGSKNRQTDYGTYGVQLMNQTTERRSFYK